MSKVYLNGRIVPATEAQVSVFDRGYSFADGVYEVLLINNGRAFRLADHQHRLAQSLQAMMMDARLAVALPEIAQQLLAANQDQAAQLKLLYLQITRGVQTPRKHDPATGIKHQVFAYLQPWDGVRARQLQLKSLPDTRWQRCDIKSIGLTANIRARLEAQQLGYDDCLFIRDGSITESSSSSFFCSDGEVVYTPPLSNYVLPSITRQVVIEACARQDIAVHERELSLWQAKQCTQLWLASTGSGICPVIRLDGAEFDPDGSIIQISSAYRDQALHQLASS